MFIHLAAAGLLLLQTAGAATKPAAPKVAPSKATSKAAAPKPAATDIAVTLTYKGKGTVDAQHQLIAWLFTETNVTSNSRPVATMSTAKNGDTLTFKNAPSGPVYLFTVYDDKGGYDGRSGPPPAGVPNAIYKKALTGDPTPLKPGDGVVLTFTDANRWNK
jgi:hypothetical protein